MSRTAVSSTGQDLAHSGPTRAWREEAPRSGRIVVGVDESVGAAAALRWAVREAGARKSSLTAVLAWDFLDQHTVAGPAFDPEYGAVDAAQALHSFVVSALGEGRAMTIEQKVVCDLPAAALIEESDGADLLVVGARGMGRVKQLLVGSVSQQCLHHATCPVAVVRDRENRATTGVNRIVVGIDGSETARRALEWAVQEARIHQASVECVHAWTSQYVDGYPLVGGFDSASVQSAARATLDAAVESVDTDGLSAPVIRTLAFGSGAEGILTAAEDADLVVVGSRGRGGFRGLLLGSVSHQTVHHATCPVVVLPPAVEVDEGDRSSHRTRPASLPSARR
jgi:nucleotide-binding universal stress UspA family protein